MCEITHCVQRYTAVRSPIRVDCGKKSPHSIFLHKRCYWCYGQISGMKTCCLKRSKRFTVEWKGCKWGHSLRWDLCPLGWCSWQRAPPKAIISSFQGRGWKNWGRFVDETCIEGCSALPGTNIPRAVSIFNRVLPCPDQIILKHSQFTALLI